MTEIPNPDHMTSPESAFNNLRCIRADGEPYHFCLVRRGHGNSQYLALYVWVMTPCNHDITGPKVRQEGREWLLSKKACVNEVVHTAWKAVEAFEMHELRERFKYRDRSIFNSHIQVNALLGVAEMVVGS